MSDTVTGGGTLGGIAGGGAFLDPYAGTLAPCGGGGSFTVSDSGTGGGILAPSAGAAFLGKPIWDTWSPPVMPTPGSTLDTSPQFIRNKFGDNYVQRMLHGLNCIQEQIQLQWPQVRITDWNTITAFLAAHAATPFLWTLPHETSARQWRAKTWQKGYATSGWYQNCQATLIRDFRLHP